MHRRRVRLTAVAIAGALSLLVGLAHDAYAQASSNESVIRRLGGSTRFAPPVRTVDALRRMTQQNRNDIARVLSDAGLDRISAQVIETMANGRVTPTTVAPGTHL